MSEPILRIGGLSKDFGGVKALDSLDLEINSGEIHGLIGPNGAGKSTLINLISGLERPSTGEIFFQGNRISGIPPEKIFEMGISRTFQDSKIISQLTVFENIAIGLGYGDEKGNRGYKSYLNRYFAGKGREREIKRKVNDIIGTLGLSSIANRWADEMAWFERQLIQIGRALISEPKLLLLDEPTAGMGNKEINLMEDKLMKINQSAITILLVSHDMNFIRRVAQKLTVLDFGAKISEGLTGQVLFDRKVREAYLGGG